MTKNWFGMTGTPTSTFFSCSPSMPSPSSCWWWSTSRGKGRATAMRTTMPSSWRESGKNRLLEDDLGREKTWYPKKRTNEVLVVHSLKVIQREKPICLPLTIVWLYHNYHTDSYFTSSSCNSLFGCFFLLAITSHLFLIFSGTQTSHCMTLLEGE